MQMVIDQSLGGWIMERKPIKLPEAYEMMNYEIMTFLRIISRPPYISDIWVRHVCDALLFPPWSSETQYETMGRDLLSRLPGHKTHDGDILVEKSYDGEQKFFLGGSGTSSYPLHHDQNDADAIFTVFEGCKEFVLVKPSLRGLLSRFKLPGFNIWNEDLYSTGLPEGALGWRGMIHQGETLYMPGDVLHEVRNGCKTTVTMCRRPWRASAVRNIEKDFKELMHETTYESLVESSWLWWGIDMTGHVFY